MRAASGKDVARISADWTEKTGFPLKRVSARVRASMSPQIEKGMDGARFQVAQKAQLVAEADAYRAARAHRT